MTTSPLALLLTHDASKSFFYPSLHVRDIITITRVCKVWHEALKSKDFEYLWIDPLKMGKVKLDDANPYIKFGELVAGWFLLYKNSFPLLDEQMDTDHDLQMKGYAATYADRLEDALRGIKEYELDVVLKVRQAIKLEEGFDASIQLYYLNLLDFSVLQRYAEKLENCCDEKELDLKLSRILYQKEGRIDFAEATLKRAKAACHKELAVDNAELKYKTLYFVVEVHLKRGNLKRALELISENYSQDELSFYHLLEETLASFINAACKEKRCDLAEALLALVKGHPEMDKWGMWQSQLIEAKKA